MVEFDQCGASKLNRGLSVFDLFVGPCGLDDTLDNCLEDVFDNFLIHLLKMFLTMFLMTLF